MPPTVSKPDCPAVDELRSYASGTLAENRALSLMEHAETCARCQQVLDGIGPDDSLAAAIRRNVDNSPTEEAALADMIGRAQQNGTDPRVPRLSRSLATRPSATRLSPAKTAPPGSAVGIDRFVDCLSKSGLMNALEATSWVMTIGSDDTTRVAQELIDREVLTRFQARAMLKGRWKGLVLDNYVVLEPLGRGGMGRVFRARHKTMQRDVCVKVMGAEGRKSAQISQRFQREIEMISTLTHPNIVVAHDAGQVDGIPYLAMELVEGCDLADFVKAHGVLPPDKAVAVTVQIAQALEYAHHQGVIHRDIKPRNLMIDAHGHVKILDLGLARFDTPADSMDSSEEPMTGTGVVMGTVDYMAPEQAMNARLAGRQSDIYSTGCTLFFLLTGRPMYGTGSVVQRLIAHREQPIPQLSQIRADVPPALDAVFTRMVAKNPSGRFATMGEVADALERSARGGVLRPVPIPRGTPVGTAPEPPIVEPPVVEPPRVESRETVISDSFPIRR